MIEIRYLVWKMVTDVGTSLPDQLLSEAFRRAQCTDIGPREFDIGLRVLADDIEHSNLPDAWSQTVRETTIDNLRRRLKLLERRASAPEIAEQVIETPVFVIGLPRTGTTALVDLLARDPRVRAPLQWEVEHLADLDEGSRSNNDPRIAAFDAQLKGRSDPVVALGLHTNGAQLPAECNTFLSLSMWSASISARGHLPRYSEWLRFSAIPEPYILHRYVLQHLQYHRGGGRWVLKSPFHVFDLPAILREYPDAAFIQTHRDPIDVMPSMCGLYSTLRREVAGSEDRLRTGRELVGFYGMGIQRAMAARRDPLLDSRVIDVSHRQFLNDPLACLEGIYERLGWSFTAVARSSAVEWIRAPAQKISSVKFSLEEFGLSASDLEENFGSYRERFGSLF